jgi:hypothetical protein
MPVGRSLPPALTLNRACLSVKTWTAAVVWANTVLICKLTPTSQQLLAAEALYRS